MEPNRRLTMQSVAEQAGVSEMTVSRALKNHPSIPQRTCRRIQKIADEMGYQVNPLVSALMTQMRSGRNLKYTPTLAFVTAYPARDRWKSQPFTMATFLGARRRCDQLGYKLEPFWLTEPGISLERAGRILRTRAVPGLIIAPLPEPPPPMPFSWEMFSCASIGFSLKSPMLHVAGSDNFALLKIAYRKLRELGYQRIGLALRYEDDDRVDNKWIAAFAACQFYQPAPRRVPALLTHDWDEKHFVSWFKKSRPDAVITLHGIVQQWITKLGQRIPEDVGVAYLDRDVIGGGVSGMDQKAELTGAAAVDLAVEQINNNDRGLPLNPKVVLIEGVWADGDTTRRRASRLAPLPIS